MQTMIDTMMQRKLMKVVLITGRGITAQMQVRRALGVGNGLYRDLQAAPWTDCLRKPINAWTGFCGSTSRWRGWRILLGEHIQNNLGLRDSICVDIGLRD